jgi:RNase H-fold protein (predicted Holliday junction resolvase)
MRRARSTTKRVLAIDPSARGISFAVFEGPEELIDWGIRAAKNDKNQDSLRHVEALAAYYQPDVMVLEDPRHTSSRRHARTQNLITDIRALASRQKIKCRCLPRSAVQRAFSVSGELNRYQIARELAGRFPELEAHLPKHRKPWIGEDERINIFDAVALAQTFLSS